MKISLIRPVHVLFYKNIVETSPGPFSFPAFSAHACTAPILTHSREFFSVVHFQVSSVPPFPGWTGGVELESFPERTLPFSFLGPKYPNPDSQIMRNEYRSPMGRVAVGQVNKEGRVEPQLNGSRTQGGFELDSNPARIPLNHPKLIFY
jgi:hypothetical protein